MSKRLVFLSGLADDFTLHPIFSLSRNLNLIFYPLTVHRIDDLPFPLSQYQTDMLSLLPFDPERIFPHIFRINIEISDHILSLYFENIRLAGLGALPTSKKHIDSRRSGTLARLLFFKTQLILSKNSIICVLVRLAAIRSK